MITDNNIKKRTKTLTYKARRYGLTIKNAVREVIGTSPQNFYRKLSGGDTSELELVEGHIESLIERKESALCRQWW